MKNKKILLLCKETFSYPFYYLAQTWKEENEVAAFFFMPAECNYYDSDLNHTTYYAYKNLSGIKLYDVRKIADLFSQNKDNPPIDYNFIKEIEHRYTNFKCLNLQLLSSQFITRQFHFRNYMKLYTQEQQIYWLELNYKCVLNLLEEFRPDVILDYDDAELPRTIVNEICHVKGIPYITVEHPRYENYKLYTFQMGQGIDTYFQKAYLINLQRDTADLQEEYFYIEAYRKKKSIMPEEYKNTITAQFESDSLLDTVKCLFGKIVYFMRQDFAAKNWKIKKKNPLIYPESWEYIKYYFRVEYTKRKLFRKNKYFEEPVKDEKYIYMPLHLIPESTTFVKAPMYINELSIIEAVSKILPIEWKLYVKEHQAMLGERSVRFYEAVNKLPNVRMMQINYYKDPKPWILNSQGVITITGTGAYEAALMGKQAIVFGDVTFSLIEGVHRAKSFEELPGLLKEITEKKDNRKSCAAYIHTVKEYGMSIKYKYLMAEGERALLKQSGMSEEYQKELKRLEQFYENALEQYLEGNQ